MKKYPKYKASGVNWTNEVPEHWESWKLSHAFSRIGSGTTPESGNPDYHDNGTINWLNTGDLNDSILDSCAKKVTKKALEDYTSLKIFPAGSLVMAMYGATIGKTSIVNFETTTNQACCVFCKSEIIDIKYLHFWFIGHKENIINLAIGGGQPNISQNILKDLRLACPSIKEQIQIANYLDSKTKQIETLITNKQKLIELLQEERTAIINQAVTKGINPKAKLKQSGIEWLGDIPEKWEVKRIKHINIKLGSGVTPKGGAETYLESGIPLLRSQNVYFNGLKLDDVAFISEETHNSMSGSKVYPNDVLINITGGSIGRCFYITNEFKEANVNQHVCIIRPNDKIKTIYLYNLLCSNIGQSQIDLCQTGGNREALNFEQLKNFYIPLPAIDEQKTIINYIETEQKRIDTIISKTEQEIELMKEYKTALISEVVTGKIDVRDEVIK
jgi:type I restriction enzyme S subunit